MNANRDNELQSVVNEGIRMKRLYIEQRQARAAAERERDVLADRVDRQKQSLATLMEQLKAAERDRGEWRERAENAEREVSKVEARAVDWSATAGQWKVRYEQAEADLADSVEEVWALEDALNLRAPAVSRADVEKVVHRFVDGAGDEFHISRIKTATNELCALFGIAQPDPVEKLARELWEVARFEDSDDWAGLLQVERDCYRRMAAHVIGQEVK